MASPVACRWGAAHRGWLALVLGGGLAGTLLHCLPGATRSPATRPVPVVLITIDTVRAERLGAYGGDAPISPAFDRWAHQGVLFETASVTAPLTLPSHATILTGLLPPQHGLRVNGRGHLPAAVTTLAETFRAAGYRTGAFLSSMVLARRHGLDRGFEVYDADTGLGGERTAAETVQRARAWLEGLENEPFFLWVHLYDAHAPYRPPEPYRSLYRQRPYDGELAYVDVEMGRLLDGLPATPSGQRSRGPDSNRWQGVVCIVGDHGEGLGSHDEQQHGLLLYESTLRVPLVIAAPGLGPQRVPTPVSTTQIGATLVWLAGLETTTMAEPFRTPYRLPLPPRHGLPEAAEPTTPVAVYAESLLGYHDYGWSPLYSFRQGRWKIVQGRYVALFDLDADADEQFDLLASRSLPPGSDERAAPSRATSARAAQLTSALARWAGTPVVGATGQATSPRAAEMDRLRSLGYLGGTPAFDKDAHGPDPRRGAAFHQRVVDILADYRDEQFDAAAAGLETLRATTPRNAFLLDLAGSVAMARGRPLEAVARFQEALTTGGERLPLQGRLAEAFLVAGRPAEAETAARAALAASSAGTLDGRTVVVLCRALTELGRQAEATSTAVNLVGRLAASDPYQHHLHRLLGKEVVTLSSGGAEFRPAHW